MEMDFFNRGDLAYIPQDVLLYRVSGDHRFGYVKTEKPTVAVILEELNKNSNDCCIFAFGGKFAVNKNHVYSMEGTHAG